MTKLRSTMIAMMCLTASLIVVAAAPAAEASNIIYVVCTPTDVALHYLGGESSFNTTTQACATI